MVNRVAWSLKKVINGSFDETKREKSLYFVERECEGDGVKSFPGGGDLYSSICYICRSCYKTRMQY